MISSEKTSLKPTKCPSAILKYKKTVFIYPITLAFPGLIKHIFRFVLNLNNYSQSEKLMNPKRNSTICKKYSRMF